MANIFRAIFPFSKELEQPKEARAALFDGAYKASLIMPGSNAYVGPLTETESLSIAAFDRGIHLIAEVVSNFPLQHFKDNEKLDLVPILERPYPLETRKQTLNSMIVDYLLYGNIFLVKTNYDKLGYPQSVIPIHPTQVTVRRLENGTILYRIGGNDYSRDEIVHIKGFCSSGELVGIGVLERAARTLRHAHTQNEQSLESLANGGMPSLAIKYPDLLAPEMKDEARDRWLLKHGNRKAPAILDGGASVEEFGFSNEQNQLLEARHFSVIEIANHLGLPSFFLNWVEGSAYTYSNIEQQAIMLVNYSLMGLVKRLEEAFTDLLPRGRYARFNLDALQRADTKTRFESYRIAIEAGFMSEQEVRDLEDLGPMPKESKDKQKKALEPTVVVQPEPPQEDIEEEDNEDETPSKRHIQFIYDDDGYISEVIQTEGGIDDDK